MRPDLRLLIAATAAWAAAAPAQIVATPKGAAAIKTASTWVALTSLSVTQGSSLIVFYASDADCSPSVVWNGVPLVQDAKASGAINSSILVLFSRHGLTAGTGDVVVNFACGGTRAMALSATQVEGLSPASALDQSATSTGAVAPASVGPTASTTQGPEYVAAMLLTEGPLADAVGAWSGDAPNIGAPRFGTTGGGPQSNLTMDERWGLQSVVGPRGASVVGFTDRSWRFVIGTYRACSLDGGACLVPGPPTQLAFTMQPSNVDPGTPITPPMEVAVQDLNGLTVTSSTALVTLSILNNPGSGTLFGTPTVAAIGGVASFSDIGVDQVGVGYTLMASSPLLTGAVSAPFNVFSGGSDAGTSDGGGGPPGSDGGLSPGLYLVGCGCSAVEGLPVATLLLMLALRSRRRA